MRSPRGCF
jgi:hypothetical protein